MKSSSESSCVSKNYLNDYYDNNFKNPQLKKGLRIQRFFKNEPQKSYNWWKEILYSL